jgi:hypothetical protein
MHSGMRTTRTRASFVLACTMLCACGGEVESKPSGTETAPPATSSGPSTPSEPSQPKTPTREGSVTIHTTSDADDGYFSITAGAEFGPKAEPGVPLEEGCVLIDDMLADAKSQGESDSAGRIDLDVVLGAKPSSLPIEFDAERKNYQYLALEADGPATGTIRFRAHGGTVPAFAASIEAIPPTKLLSPAPGAAIGARDLPLSWTYDGPDRHSIIYLSSLEKDVRCFVKQERALVIPGALVGEVLASKGEIRLLVLTAATTWIDVGDYHVSVSHNTSTHNSLARE